MTVAARLKAFRRLLSGKGKVARAVRIALYAKLCLLLAVGVTVGALYVRLSAGPLSFAHLPERVAAAIAGRMGPGWSVELRNTALMLEHGALALRATELDIRNPEGALVLRAPFAVISVDGYSLMTANLQPRSIEFRDLQLRALINRDGSISVVPPEEGAPVAKAAAAPAALDPAGPSPVSVALGSVLEFLTGTRGVVGGLDRAVVSGARLTLVDEEGRERAAFSKADVTLSRTEDGGRRFEASFTGPQGTWSLDGETTLEEGGVQRAMMIATAAPAQDLLLLSGLSSVPATTDLKLSGRLDALVVKGRTQTLTASLESNAGTIKINDKDTSPLAVQRLAIDAAWDESRRTLMLPALSLEGGATRVKLAGELVAPSRERPWQATLSGRDATVAGAAPGDAPVAFATIEAALSGRDGIRVDKLKLRGPAIDADVTALLAATADPNGLQIAAKGTKTSVRAALRLWPEAAATQVRRFFVDNLKSGTIDSIDLQVAMTGEDLSRAMNKQPVPEKAVAISFAVSDGVLAAADGMPPLSKAVAIGTVTGVSTSLKSPSARVEMRDGRALAVSDGAFAVDDFWSKIALGRMTFRLTGGADALGSLLAAPLIQEAGATELDPATLKGRTDLRVAMSLPFGAMPKLAELPLSVAGTVSDLSIDRIFGREKLEGANLAVAYDNGVLAIKGDGKLAGAPASVDVHQTRDVGEATLAFTLDDAARARKGMGLGTQVTGPIALKASVPFGKGTKAVGVRVEADLSRSAIDGLIPGWQKAAGKPGKLAMVVNDLADRGVELKDLQLDSAPVQLRGSALLGADGSFEKADLSTLRISQGDDMRAQVDRNGGVFKVVVRGNVGDARPFARSLNGSPAPAGRGSAPGKTKDGKDAADIDLDLALNILTGYGGEAITNAVVKTSIRKESIRALEVKGRLGSSNVSAQTLSRGGSPLILVEAADAGGVLRFLDVYRRMSGGELVLQLAAGEGPQSGFLTLRDFVLQNEPALRRIIPTQSQVVPGQDSAGNRQNVRIDVNEVAFTQARVDFVRTAGRLDFKDAAIWGGAIGFTLSGFMDYGRDQLDISGTFVPAYGLNNAFAQVPLFGPLLGGGRNEGLFAVNFRIAGATATPTLTVNPLSAVAPGFLRKLFGTGGDPPTGSLQGGGEKSRENANN